ncbi:hypothetical protein [Bradyrhizobium sp. DASA03120]|uniref:hypothetical protein n=1 Tax=Bradyrhizobium sp. SMVTL-02 TaxID=3395917 RepID=UPI003F720AFA
MRRSYGVGQQQPTLPFDKFATYAISVAAQLKRHNRSELTALRGQLLHLENDCLNRERLCAWMLEYALWLVDDRGCRAGDASLEAPA